MERFEEKVKKAFASRLKKARLAANFRFAKDFAETIKVDEHRYRSWERGDHLPDIPTTTRICRVLNIEPNELMPLALKPKSHPRRSSGTEHEAA